MGNIRFCKDKPKHARDISHHSVKSGMTFERFERNVFDDYECIEKLGEGSTSTVSSIMRRDPNANDSISVRICSGWIGMSNLIPKKDAITCHTDCNRNNIDEINSDSNIISDSKSNNNDVSVSSRIKSFRDKVYALKEIDLNLMFEEYADELRNEA